MRHPHARGLRAGLAALHLATHLEGRVAALEAGIGGIEGGDQAGHDVGAVAGRHEKQNLDHSAVKHLQTAQGGSAAKGSGRNELNASVWGAGRREEGEAGANLAAAIPNARHAYLAQAGDARWHELAAERICIDVQVLAPLHWQHLCAACRWCAGSEVGVGGWRNGGGGAATATPPLLLNIGQSPALATSQPPAWSPYLPLPAAPAGTGPAPPGAAQSGSCQHPAQHRGGGGVRGRAR